MSFKPWDIALPLGISFFTFQQISYLLDLYRGQAPFYDLRRFTAYITFFPQLIAGPIVRHNQLIDQFSLDPKREGLYERLSKGFVLFLLGLVKKVLLADGLAEIASPLFGGVPSGGVLTFAEAWVAAGSYTLQIYFDFSGYSDMAIGLGMMFGFSIPRNFNAPYRATSVREFWQRWHITLSNFLRDYLYITLGGNRFGISRQSAALIITMILCGLWHGAGWTYIVYGAYQGLGMVTNLFWSKTGIRLSKHAAWTLTMLFTLCGMVIFRSETPLVAGSIITSMSGFRGFSMIVNNAPNLWQILLFSIPALFGPTSEELAFNRLKPRPAYAIVLATTFVILSLRIGDAIYSEFIYFQF